MRSSPSALLLFPHQLFEDALSQPKSTEVFLVEDDLFFKQYAFHKQKLILHRSSMMSFKDRLVQHGYSVQYIQTSSTASMDALQAALTVHTISAVQYYDPTDDWLQKRIAELLKTMRLGSEVLPSPAFLTSRGAIDDFFSSRPKRMQSFYEWQRKRLGVLVENDQPVGGRWSFDAENRKKLPRGIELPQSYAFVSNMHVDEAIKWVGAEFPNNPGRADSFEYAVTHEQAYVVLEQFLSQRLALFGPYEDAIASEQSQLFHSVLSPLLNIGLITPHQVVQRTLEYAQQHNTPIESLEGFIRQIIGWREYMRATYIQYGSEMRTQNILQHSRKLSNDWWTASTGIAPIDQTLQRVLDSAYAHHIERLMIFGNAMLLLRIDPDDVYKWFMSMFIDAYDWVMVPNVYAMSQFAVGTKITTKPYISGSNYIVKMSDYKKAEWSDVWDALYWRFINDHRAVFASNPRSSMMLKLYEKLTPEKKESIATISAQWLK